ncbi:hypothetical protein DCAR_0936088 [Daucus carota subsp. sativus]|uniref:Uncharacterized protein n=1 Tax=Daucus carota subsp. sativus TaxID=79200 RepID=A0A175YJK5_DAUCS|nr:PREDICTED: uncharacterized protein LOC108201728 [Daucus carota subsp. sativus]WOH16533.1 hypothetical protein DCAR_0936088 [Daucus carota subsp. sativus]
MEVNFGSSSTQSLLSHEDEEKEIVSEGFNFKFNFFGSSTKQEGKDSNVEKDGAYNETEVDYDNADDEEEFSFVIDNSSSMPVSGNSAFTNAQIQPKFSLFNRDLQLPQDNYTVSENQLPSESHVKEVLTKTSPDMTLHKGEPNPTYGTSPGLYYAGGKKSLELSQKSNSAGFSRLWGLQDVLHRSNSDGSDSFIAKAAKLHRSLKENNRRWTMKMYSHQSRIEVQKNKLFLASARK